MPSFPTFTELLLHRVAERPDQDAYIFLHDSSTAVEPEHVTYQQLDLRARHLGAWLQERDLLGERVLMLYANGLEFAKAFAGCLYAGVVAVPSPLPDGHGQAANRVGGIVRDAGIGVVLTDLESHAAVTAWLEREGLDQVECLATDGPVPADPDAWTKPGFGPSHLAFLQYTSGSTSDPKGVMVSHRNLLANQEVLKDVLGTTDGDMLGSWLPYFHDMGLIGFLLHALHLGSTLVLMSPTSFLKRPYRWLEMVSDYQVSLCGGPNFAYDLCTRRVTDEQLAGLDLSSWRSALNGSEPIRAQTLADFADRFAAAGFRRGALHPGYGMAEATLGVSGSPLLTEPVVRTVSARSLERNQLEEAVDGELSLTLVSSGRVHGFDLRVVDPETREVLADGQVGEIWLRGASVAVGYWQREDATEEIFHAVTADGESGFLRTGDLGTVFDRELFVTGRCKELLIFQGRNVYPQDVEQVVQGFAPVLGQGPGVVFTVPAEDREVAVVVQEIRPGAVAGLDLEALAASVQWGVSREFDIPVGAVLLAKPGTVRKTTSGKLQRSLMRKLFLDGEVHGIEEVLSAEVSKLIGRPAPELPAASAPTSVSVLAG